MTYILHSQRCSYFRFSILPALYTEDTFAPFSNFEAGHFAHHFLFLSLLLWKEFNSHSFIVTFHFPHSLGSPPVFYPAVDDCWTHVNVGCSACIYNISPVASLNDESWLAHRRQQSTGSAFQFHYKLKTLNLVGLIVKCVQSPLTMLRPLILLTRITEFWWCKGNLIP